MEQIYEKLEAIGASVEKFKERQEQKFNDLQVRLSGIPQHAPALAPVEEAQGRDFERFLRGGEGQKSLSTGEAPGEYLLPAPVQKRIHEGLLAQGVFRALASVMEVSSSHVDLVLDQGLPGAGWVQEGGERPETEGPTLRHHRIETHELYAKPLATQTLLEDSHVNVEEWLVDRVVDKMTHLENEAFLFGSGKGMPKGLLTYPLVTDYAGDPQTLQSFTLNFLDNVSKKDLNIIFSTMLALPAQYREGAHWIMSRSALGLLRECWSAFGQAKVLEEGYEMKVFGFPVMIMDELPLLPSEAGSIFALFGNFKVAYQIVDRYPLSILRDPYSAKPYVELYIHKRVGGDLLNGGAVKVIQMGERVWSK